MVQPSIPAMQPREAFGVALKRLRKERDRSQEATAHEAGLSLTSLARIETGRQEARFGTILRLAAALRISPAELVAEAERTLQRRSGQSRIRNGRPKRA